MMLVVLALNQTYLLAIIMAGELATASTGKTWEFRAVPIVIGLQVRTIMALGVSGRIQLMAQFVLLTVHLRMKVGLKFIMGTRPN
jgi:hypothetical protein